MTKEELIALFESTEPSPEKHKEWMESEEKKRIDKEGWGR